MTEHEEQYYKSLDKLEQFLENNRGLSDFNSIAQKFNQENPDIKEPVLGMLYKLTYLGLTTNIHPYNGQIGKFIFNKRHSVGHYEQAKIIELKELEGIEHRKKERENIEASIKVADSVIETNKNQKGFNKTTSKTAIAAVIVASMSAIPLFVGLFRDLNGSDKVDNKFLLKELLQERTKMQREIDSLKYPKPQKPSDSLTKKNP